MKLRPQHAKNCGAANIVFTEKFVGLNTYIREEVLKTRKNKKQIKP